MTTTKTTVTVHCDCCGRIYPTKRTTTKGARGDAQRSGWRTATLYSYDNSADAAQVDMCAECARHTRTMPDDPRSHYYAHRDGCSALQVGLGCTCDWRERIRGAA